MRKLLLLGLSALFALGVGFAQDTGGAETGGAETGGADVPPTVESTVELFDGGITEVPLDAALANIQGWEATLREADNPDLTAIADNLEQLATALQADPVDGAEVADLLSQLGDQTRTAAEGADVDEDTASQLSLLASLLTQVGQQLSGETGGG